MMAQFDDLRSTLQSAPWIIELPIGSAFRIEAMSSGPEVLILGAVHGDETCGSLAIGALLARFADRSLTLWRGRLTLAIGNEEALRRRVRKVEVDLNRCFIDGPDGTLDSYERRRVEDLKPLLRAADYMLDLHATSLPSVPFLMCEEPVLPFARALGISPIVLGWGSLGAGALFGDTETYVNAHGGRGMTVENGARDWPGGADSALVASLNLLTHLAMIDGVVPEPRGDAAVYRLFHVHVVERPGFRYSRPFQTFDRLHGGEEIGRDLERVYVAPAECVIVMPTDPEQVKPGEDLYLLGRRVV
jgi:predicted deacylase